MASDAKKAATVVYHALKILREVQAGTTKAQAARDAVTTHGLAGLLPAGSAAALNAWVNGLAALGTDALITQLEASEVPTHRGDALKGELT